MRGGHVSTDSALCVENAKSPEVYKQRYEAVRALLDQTKDLAATLHPEDKEEVLRLVSELEALNEELKRLEESGEVSEALLGQHLAVV